MTELLLNEKIYKLQGSWSLHEIALALWASGEFERRRAEIQLLSGRDRRLLQQLYVEQWTAFTQLTQQQIERWEEAAGTSCGGRGVESRFHADLWRTRLAEEVERHEHFLHAYASRRRGWTALGLGGLAWDEFWRRGVDSIQGALLAAASALQRSAPTYVQDVVEFLGERRLFGWRTRRHSDRA